MVKGRAGHAIGHSGGAERAYAGLDVVVGGIAGGAIGGVVAGDTSRESGAGNAGAVNPVVAIADARDAIGGIEARSASLQRHVAISANAPVEVPQDGAGGAVEAACTGIAVQEGTSKASVVEHVLVCAA